MWHNKSTLVLIFIAGFTVGTLDMFYACLFWDIKADVSPLRIFQSVAAGLLGQQSFQGGYATAALGLGLHFLIAILMAATYIVATLRLAWLNTSPYLYGSLYGAALYSIMHFIVLPLSAAGPSTPDTIWITLTVLVHMLLVGVPIALFARGQSN
ncbi:hypothetical protein [Neptunicella sp. SCSIO 80796]|uniref:hypothetical protein n=1 Tax=Neptunicella plasticusilytica TaxID=3117012 RepID=UPI003A4D6723